MQHSIESLRRRARELSIDEGFKAVVAVLKNRAISEWANTGSADQYRREELYRDVQAVGRLENLIREIIDGEKVDVRKAERAAKKR